jgi:hypothetical protein
MRFADNSVLGDAQLAANFSRAKSFRPKLFQLGDPFWRPAHFRLLAIKTLHRVWATTLKYTYSVLIPY